MKNKTDNLHTWPETIYLQVHDEEGPLPDIAYCDTNEIVWCDAPVVACEVAYVRADLVKTFNGCRMSWIDDELEKAHKNLQFTTIVVMSKKYIEALEALKTAEYALQVATTPLPKDRQLVLAAQRKIMDVKKCPP